MIQINGKPISQFGMIVEQGHEHPTPNFTPKTVKVPGVAGEYHFGNEISSRPHVIPLSVLEPSRSESQIKVRSFLEECLDSQGKPKPIDMVYDYEPDKHYTVYLEGQVSPSWLKQYGNMSFNLVAYDPWAYSDLNVYDEYPGQYDSGLQYDSSLMYENVESFEWVYPTHYTGSYNHSYYSTPLIMEIKGTVTNPSLTEMKSGQVMKLPSLSNQKLVVNASTYTATVDGVNAFSDVTNIDLLFKSGDIKLKFEGGSPNATVTFKWKHKFM